MKYQDLPVDLDKAELRQRADKYIKKRSGLLFSKAIPEEDRYWAQEVHPAYAIMICSDLYNETENFKDITEHNWHIDKIVKKAGYIGVFDNVFYQDMLDNIRVRGNTAVGDESFWFAAQFLEHTITKATFHEDYYPIYKGFLTAYLDYVTQNNFPNDEFERLQTHLDKMENTLSYFEKHMGELPDHPMHEHIRQVRELLVEYATHEAFDPFHNPIESDLNESNGAQRIRLFKKLYKQGDERVSDHYDYLIENTPEQISHQEYDLLTDCANYWYEKLLAMLESTENPEVLARFSAQPMYNGVIYTLMNHKVTGEQYSDEQFESAVEDAWNTRAQLEVLFNILGNHPMIKPMRLQIKERLGTLAHQDSLETEAHKTRVAQEQQASHAAAQARYQQQQAEAATAAANAAQATAIAANRQANETARIRRKIS